MENALFSDINRLSAAVRLAIYQRPPSIPFLTRCAANRSIRRPSESPMQSWVGASPARLTAFLQSSAVLTPREWGTGAALSAASVTETFSHSGFACSLCHCRSSALSLLSNSTNVSQSIQSQMQSRALPQHSQCHHASLIAACSPSVHSCTPGLALQLI